MNFIQFVYTHFQSTYVYSVNSVALRLAVLLAAVLQRRPFYQALEHTLQHQLVMQLFYSIACAFANTACTMTLLHGFVKLHLFTFAIVYIHERVIYSTQRLFRRL